MRSARAWRDYYAAERASLGDRGLDALFDSAPTLRVQKDGVWIFPHTRLRDTGGYVAAVAEAVVQSGCDTVLAIGVLHGARECDAVRVAAARRGDPDAISVLRGVHDDTGHAADEFSLDGFAALLARAAHRRRRAQPRLIARYPFLVGESPETLRRLDALCEIRSHGALLVATADPVHHGIGYGTPTDRAEPFADAATRTHAHEWVESGLRRLAVRDWRGFLDNAASVRSDFRDAGPVARILASEAAVRATVHSLTLVDYSETLPAPAPTWVAGALAELTAPE